MALTPEDVVNKRFQPTKFREGYDQDEVDDFLDEVVVELRRLNQENEELKQRLTASDSRISELQRSGGAQSSEVQASAAEAPAAETTAAPAEQPVPVEQPAPVAAVPVGPAPGAEAAAPADAEADEAASTNNLLQLARRLHEEHVREGAQKRDALIAEGHATAARVVAEAEAKQRAQINALDEERTSLETKIDELRTFERDYRQKLRGYIEGQLHDLDSTAGTSTGSFPATGTGSQPQASGASNTGSVETPQPPTYQGFGS